MEVVTVHGQTERMFGWKSDKINKKERTLFPWHGWRQLVQQYRYVLYRYRWQGNLVPPYIPQYTTIPGTVWLFGCRALITRRIFLISIFHINKKRSRWAFPNSKSDMIRPLTVSDWPTKTPFNMCDCEPRVVGLRVLVQLRHTLFECSHYSGYLVGEIW